MKSVHGRAPAPAPVVIHVPVQKVVGPRSGGYWGLGDIVRGSITLHRLCKERGYTFIIDYSHHPISQWLVPVSHSYPDVVRKAIPSMEFTLAPDLSRVLHNLKNRVLCIHTNGFISDWECVDTEILSFIRLNLQPNLELTEHIAKSSPGVDTFRVLHIRAGDSEFHTQVGMPLDVDVLAKRCEPFLDGNNLLISDSYDLKTRMKEKFPWMLILPTRPAHCGLTTEKDKLLDTLIDFYVSGRASCIHTFSTYSWVSGFAKAVAYAFRIPVKTL